MGIRTALVHKQSKAAVLYCMNFELSRERHPTVQNKENHRFPTDSLWAQGAAGTIMACAHLLYMVLASMSGMFGVDLFSYRCAL